MNGDALSCCRFACKIYAMPIENQNWRELLKQCFCINLAATFIAILFYSAVDGLESVFSVEHIVSSFVYSNSIGTLSSIVIFCIAPQWTDNPTIVRLGKVSISIFLATIIGVIIARLILGDIFPGLSKQGLFPGSQNFVFALGIAFAVGFGVYFFESSQTRLRQSVSVAEKERTLATQAQLASLESRIHPHFLFNTLNSIAALIREDPILAERMVERLSALLRYSLDVNSNRLVPLSQELEITKKYLEIEKVRFDSRLHFTIETIGEISQVGVPPLALQTLVENSIKHVASLSPGQTSIGILATADDRELTIKVSDSGPGFSADSIVESHGLDLLRKRLAAIFGDLASLSIGIGTVQLKLPFKRHDLSSKDSHEGSDYLGEKAL